MTAPSSPLLWLFAIVVNKKGEIELIVDWELLFPEACSPDRAVELHGPLGAEIRVKVTGESIGK
jgi:hypothetical protein